MEIRTAYEILFVKPEETEHLVNLGVNRRITLKYVLEKWDGGGLD
jgi:hypothetical protein